MVKLTAPSRQQTAQGYVYYRCRAGGDDSTVYEHQLVSILGGSDPYDVFSEDYDVHHVDHCRVHNLPENLELVDRDEHREQHLNGGWPVVDAGALEADGDRADHAGDRVVA